MAAYTYTTLKAALQDYAGDIGSKLSSAIDNTILQNAEGRVLRDLNLELFDVTGNVTFSSGVPLVTKPAGWLATRSLIYIASNVSTVLIQRSYEYLVDYWPDSSQTSTPQYYCEFTDASWMVAAPPTQSVTGLARYMKRPTGLTSSNASTWLGTNAGDLLFKAAMIEFLLWSKNTSTAGYGKSNLEAWEGEYAILLSGSKVEFKHLIRNESMQGDK